MALHGERGMRATIVKSMNYLDRERSRIIHNKFMSMILIIIIFVQLCDALTIVPMDSDSLSAIGRYRRFMLSSS